MDLEPRERNPAEIRKTIFILISVMIIGAVFVLSAYKRHEASMDKERPPISARLSKNLGAKNQDGKVLSLSVFENKVWFVAPLCVTQLEENKYALNAMKELVEHYRGNDNVGFALISTEGVDMGVGPEELNKAAKALDLDTTRITLFTTGDTRKQRGYIKDQLRLGIVSERPEGDPAGKWKFPSQIALIDQGMHLRQRYDFREVYQSQQTAEKDLQENPELAQKKDFDRYINAVANLKETLHKNTAYVLAEVTLGSKE
ncbi:hypothetical protein OAI07_01000 [Akkermansiaceae bacterium]|nr:hypothetical protein [Akkermansiaceae bacterium]